MFRGVNSISVDAKGRFAVPTKYREGLKDNCAGQLVLTIDISERCLLIYEAPEWEQVERKLMKLPTFNKNARALQRVLIGHASEVEMDGQGRILLPAPLREYARLEKAAVLVGQGNKLEMWSEETWNARRDAWIEAIDVDELAQETGIGDLSI